MNGETEAERQIRGVIARWLEAVGRKDAAAIAELYMPDGRLLVPNSPIAEGREAVARMWEQLLSMPNIALSFGPTLIESAQSGELAYEIGTYSLGFDREGARIEDRGKYVVVWKRDADSWKAAADILNSDLPLAA